MEKCKRCEQLEYEIERLKETCEILADDELRERLKRDNPNEDNIPLAEMKRRLYSRGVK